MDIPRYAIFIDGNTIFQGAKIHGCKIDYEKLTDWEDILDQENQYLVRKSFYSSRAGEETHGKLDFLHFMKRNDFRVIERRIAPRGDGRYSDIQVCIACDLLTFGKQLDELMIIGPSLALETPITRLQQICPVRIRVAGFKSSTHPKIIDLADEFIEFHDGKTTSDGTVIEPSNVKYWAKGGSTWSDRVEYDRRYEYSEEEDVEV